MLERSPAYGEVGAGLGLTANGIAALDAIGAGDAVRAAGHPVSHAGYQDYPGRWVKRMPGTPPGVASVNSFLGIHRQRLHAAVLEAARAAGASLVRGAQVTAIQPGAPAAEPAEVTWRPAVAGHTVRWTPPDAP